MLYLYEQYAVSSNLYIDDRMKPKTLKKRRHSTKGTIGSTKGTIGLTKGTIGLTRRTLRSLPSFVRNNRTHKRHSIPNLFHINISESKQWNNEFNNENNNNANIPCELPGMTRDAIQERPNSELSKLLNAHSPRFTCTMSDKKGCPSYRLLNKMNQKGVYGVVFKSCCNPNGIEGACDYVTKVVHFPRRNHSNTNNHLQNVTQKEEFMNELRMQAKAATIGVAPPIRKVLLSASKGIVIMDSMKEDLEDVMQQSVLDSAISETAAYDMGTDLANQIGEQIMKLHSYNIIHGDIHQNNVMFDRHGKCKLIDYGMAMTIPMEFLAEEYLRNNNISSQIIDAYRRDYMMSLDKTMLRGMTERKLFKKNDSMPVKVKLRSLFEGLSEGLDGWLEMDMDRLYERVNKYIKERNVV